ncbi:hypothetical protein HMPREF9973_01895, partial [Staphylococcus epidermidis NIH05001]
ELIAEININNSIIILSLFIIISNKRVNIKEIEITLNFIQSTPTKKARAM